MPNDALSYFLKTLKHTLPNIAVLGLNTRCTLHPVPCALCLVPKFFQNHSKNNAVKIKRRQNDPSEFIKIFNIYKNLQLVL
jgi:hypothetical protein